MRKADGWMTRVSNCVGKLIRKWEEVESNMASVTTGFQPDSESLQSKLTSVTGFSRTASHVESNRRSVKL